LDAEGDAGIRPPLEKMPALYPKMLAAMSISWDEYMSQFTQNAELKAVFSTLWGYYGLPPEKLNAARLFFRGLVITLSVRIIPKAAAWL
jgi:hypothetical protein